MQQRGNVFSHEKLPVEVWHDIFEHLLNSIAGFSLDSDPLESQALHNSATTSSNPHTLHIDKRGVNAHSLLDRWESPSIPSLLFQQRLTLLLVCKAWNGIVTRVGLPYIRLHDAYVYKWPNQYIYRAKRLHMEYESSKFTSLWKDALSPQEREDNEKSQPQTLDQARHERLTSQSHSRSKPSFCAEILTLNNNESKDFLDACSRFPSLRALTIVKVIDNLSHFSSAMQAQSFQLFSNLVYLHIVVTTPGLLLGNPQTNSDSESSSGSGSNRFGLTFASLTTLRYTFHYIHNTSASEDGDGNQDEDEDMINILGEDCIMPKLRNLFIICPGAYFQSIHPSKIFLYLRFVGKNLLNLAIHHPILLLCSPGILDECPRLVSLATVIEFPFFLPQSSPKLDLDYIMNTDPREQKGIGKRKVRGNLQVLVHTGNMSSFLPHHLLRIIEHFSSLRVFGALHDWYQVLHQCKDQPRRNGGQSDPLHTDLIAAAEACSRRGIRFEDYKGRILEEVIDSGVIVDDTVSLGSFTTLLCS